MIALVCMLKSDFSWGSGACTTTEGACWFCAIFYSTGAVVLLGYCCFFLSCCSCLIFSCSSRSFSLSMLALTSMSSLSFSCC
jgi:hypothetical protein